MPALVPRFSKGTQRLCCPQETLERIEPHWRRCGITRLADLTQLDTLGIPTYSAVRPGGQLRQSSMGKGLSTAAAKASALMEGIEVYHAETPEPEDLHDASRDELGARGYRTFSAAELPGHLDGSGGSRSNYPGGVMASSRRRLPWVKGWDLLAHEEVFVPASSVYCQEPALTWTTTNGLASGNHPVEAMLHALFEIVEREAMSGVSVNGRLQVRETCARVDLGSVDSEDLQDLIGRITRAGATLVLLWRQSPIPVHTFWAIILDPHGSPPLHSGSGSHASLEVAACRAVTEAAQTRLAHIQSSREEFGVKAPNGAYPARRKVVSFFLELEPQLTWQQLQSLPALGADRLDVVATETLAALAAAGYQHVLRFDLTKPKLDIPVVKIIIPKMRFDDWLH